MTSFLFLPSSPLSFGPPSGLWNYLELFGTPSGPWNARSASGTALGQWNARSAIGTASGLGTREAPLERPLASGTAARLLRPLYCSLAGDNISVLLSAPGTPEGQLEQPQASGTREALLERPQGLWNRASGSPWNAPWRTIASRIHSTI